MILLCHHGPWSGGVAAADSRPEPEGASIRERRERAGPPPAPPRPATPARGLKEVIEAKAKEGVKLLEQQHSESREARRRREGLRTTRP